MKYYTHNNEVLGFELDGSQDSFIPQGAVLMTDVEVEAFKNPPKTPEQVVAHFKSMYLATVDAKLKAMDYDSLATVKLWADDATFGAEAIRILTWYKAIIAMNYQLLNDVGAGTIPMPTEVEYQAMIDGVVF